MAEEDILYGKNRHLFGGIAPSNMKKFEVRTTPDGMCYLDYELPSDTVIDGQVLCDVGGVVIRKKREWYPENEFDGDFVTDAKCDGSVCLGILPNDEKYGTYYSAFPYSTQGVYNRSHGNRAYHTIPGKINSINAKYILSTKTVSVRFTYDKLTNRDNCYIAMLSDDGYATCETFKDSAAAYWLGVADYYDCSWSIEPDIEKPVRYITVFSGARYDDGYLRPVAPIACTMVNVASYEYLYGYDLDPNNENPETRVTYPDDVMNKGYLPAFMNFETDRFDCGSWDLNPGEHFMPKPCMVSFDGNVMHYLDPSDYSKREDGSPSSVSDTECRGDAMVEWPIIYTKRWTDADGIYHFRCSDQKLDDEYECWCNYDANNNVIDHFYTSIYSTSSITRAEYGLSQQYRSLSTIGSAMGAKLDDARNYASVTNDNDGQYQHNLGWDIAMLADHLLIQDLLVMIGKSTNTQTVFGWGIGDGTSAIENGTMDDKGMFWGKDNYVYGIKVFGMENLWGNYRYFVAGWTLYNKKHYVKLTKGTRDYEALGSSYSGTYDAWARFNASNTSVVTTNIVALGGSNITGSKTSSTYGFISNMYTHPFGRLPLEAKGDSSKYECDEVSWTTATDTIYAYAAGSSRNDKVDNGMFFATVINQTSVGETSNRLSLKPPKNTIVEGE